MLYGSHNPGSNKLDGQEEPNETRSTSRPRTAVIPHVPKSRLDDDTTALHRLLANLQASVPLCLLLTIYFPVSAELILYFALEVVLTFSLLLTHRLHSL